MVTDCFYCGSSLAALTPHDLDKGQRIAFDPQLGRLWRVCAECARWNLTPIESRWEIVEECERLASSAKVVVRTERLALLSCGLGQLIRVGVPARLEFAEWRYSSRLDQCHGVRGRFRRMLLALPEMPVGGYDLHGTVRVVPQAWLGSPFIDYGAVLGGLFSATPLADACPACAQPLFIHPASFGDLRLESVGGEAGIVAPCGLCGDEVIVKLREARPAIRAGLGIVNRKHRAISQVQRAVAPLDRVGGPQQFVTRLTQRSAVIGELPRPARLALWIALDELAEAEALEVQWAYAEDLARIADNELTHVRGFQEFRLRVLSDSPAD